MDEVYTMSCYIGPRYIGIRQYDIADNIINDHQEQTKLELEPGVNSDDKSVEQDSTRPSNKKHEVSRHETVEHIVGEQEKEDKQELQQKMNGEDRSRQLSIDRARNKEHGGIQNETVEHLIDDQHGELELRANSEIKSPEQSIYPSINREHKGGPYNIAESISDDQQEENKLDFELDVSSDDSSVELDSTRSFYARCLCVVWCKSKPWWLYLYFSWLLHLHRGNDMIALLSVKQPWRIWEKGIH